MSNLGGYQVVTTGIKGLFRVECGRPGGGRGLRVEVEVLDDERTSTSRCLQGPWAVSHPTCRCSVSLDRCDRCDLPATL